MALELYMLGLIVADMDRSLPFYRQLGVEFPAGSEGKSHVEVKMGNMSFFLDSRPDRWDPQYEATPDVSIGTNNYRSILEFYLHSAQAVTAKFDELTALGYSGPRPPYATSFGMCFAMLQDPDGNMILLSGDLEKAES